MAMSMADLLAKQDNKVKTVSRGQAVDGTVISVSLHEVIIDLGTKSEGVLSRRDLPLKLQEEIKVGDKLEIFILQNENESGQIIVSLQKAFQNTKPGVNSAKFQKFQNYLQEKRTLNAKGVEVNKGGVVVEVNGMRGFLPTSQVALKFAANLDDLVGKEISVLVIEADPSQNRLIFSQKSEITPDAKEKLSQVKEGDIIKGEISAVLPFGIYVKIDGLLEGLVHVSEVSWERQEDLNNDYKIGQEIEAKVLSVDKESGRVNLTMKALKEDPFTEAVKKYQVDDVIKVTVSKVTPQGVTFVLEGDIEGFLPSSKIEPGSEYQEGQSLNLLVDSIDEQKRRINLSPFITSTKDLIYK